MVIGVGPLIGGLVKDSFGLDAAFLSMGMLAFIGLIACVWMLPPTHVENAARTRKRPFPWKHLLYDRTVAALFLFRFAYVVCIGIIWGFVPLYADLRLSLDSSAIGTLIALGILTSGAMNVPMGIVADRVNKKMLAAIGGLIASYAIFSFAGADSFGAG